ncbi:ribosome biogenesis GTPase Der [Caldicellulosiruptoraceae bacterium PP1]
MKPTVAIVGRPNVGKSTLFNRLIGERRAIVDDIPGVTRDRIIGTTEWNGITFDIIDTGGIEPYSEDIILKQMRRQAQFAIDMSDVIIFMVDGREGLNQSDKEVADMLRKSKKHVVLAVNKIDNYNMENNKYEFYELGFGDPISISSEHGSGIGDVLDLVVSLFEKEGINETEDDSIKVSIIGKPNTGKSSLVNRILGEERLIVSDIPGTTRDAIDTAIEFNSKRYTLIDTAGIRRKSKIYDEIEKYSILRTKSAIERSDICIIMIDATEEVSEQDAKVAGLALEAGKGCIIAVNKWDAVEKNYKSVEEYKTKVYEKLSFLTFAPIIFISAKTGLRINKLLEMVDYVYQNYTRRITTGQLNDVLAEATTVFQPPSDKGKQLKIYYMTQVGSNPPKIALFVNEKKLFHFSYQRYIENYIRKTYDFVGTPLFFIIREKGEKI